MNRRMALTAGIVAIAGAAGVGTSLWRARNASNDLPPGLWDLAFDTPQAGRLQLASFRGKPLLMNFWASWCPPCVSELPLIDKFRREQIAKGWEVLGVAVDTLEPVRAFLAKSPVGFPIALAGMEGVGLSRTLGNTTGALPFSVVFDGGGRPVHRKLGVLTPEDLENWVREIR
jgi:thiol-disulfide isomerase/thioredoxin